MSEQLSASDIAAALYAKQGYLVIGATHLRTIGQLIRTIKHLNFDTMKNEEVIMPMRVIAESNRAEFQAQVALVVELKGWDLSEYKANIAYATHFYRVEALD